MNLPWRVKAFIVFLAVLCLVSLAFAARVVSPPSVNEVAIFFILSILAVLAEIYATWIPPYKMEMSSSIATYLAALFILGPSLAVFLVFGTCLLSELVLRWDRLKEGRMQFVTPVVFNVSQFTVAITVTGLVLTLSGHQRLLLQEFNHYPLAIAAFISYLLLNLSLVTEIVSLAEGKSFFYLLWKRLREFSIQNLALGVLALLLVVLYSISIWHIFLVLFPLILVHVSFRSYMRLQTETRKTFEKISRILDERDHYTAVHSSEVAELAVKIGQEMGLPQGEIEKIDIAARVHDVGKIAVPDAILLKPTPLTEEEWEVMKRHPLISAELIEGLEIYTPVADAVRHEHERWDGSGYPDGLKGKEIPFLARIIAAADIYNALTTPRPYRKAFTREQAVESIQKMRGKDLDPIVTDALLRVIASQRT